MCSTTALDMLEFEEKNETLDLDLLFFNKLLWGKKTLCSVQERFGSDFSQ